MTLIKKEYRIIFLHITPRSPNDSNIVTWPTVLAAQKKQVDRPIKIPLTQQPILFIFYYSICQDNQSPTIMSIANNKGITLFLNQVNHTSIIFDHDSDPGHPSPVMGLVISRMLALRNNSPPNTCFMQYVAVVIELMTLALIPLVRIKCLLLC